MASLVVEHGLLGTQASAVVAHGLTCPKAYGIFLDQASNLCPLHWQVGSQPPDHQGSPDRNFLNECLRKHLVMSVDNFLLLCFGLTVRLLLTSSG